MLDQYVKAIHKCLFFTLVSQNQNQKNSKDWAGALGHHTIKQLQINRRLSNMVDVHSEWVGKISLCKALAETVHTQISCACNG